MTKPASLDVADQWGRLNDGLIDLIGYIPDDKLDWSPRDDLWTFRSILSHVASARGNWLTGRPRTREDLLAEARTKDAIRDQLRRSWALVERFLSDQSYVSRVYEGERDGSPYRYDGQWIAFHLLEHDVHHRADVFHYLALLNIEPPEVETP